MTELRVLKNELLQVRELVGVLLRRARSAETKADCDQKSAQDEWERDDEHSEAECVTSLKEALANQSKFARVVVDEDFGFGRDPTGEIDPIQRCPWLALTHGAQVVSDHVRADGTYPARRPWVHNAWRGEQVKEKANKVPQQVSRAAALTAELAVQAEKVVCDHPDHPLTLHDQLAEYIAAPSMDAGG